MDEKKFMDMMDEILNIDIELKMETNLGEIEEWDSLAYIMFQSYVAREKRSMVDTSTLKQAKTISDLYDLVK